MVAFSSGDESKFAYTRDNVPAAVPSEPALGAVLVSALVRPLPRGLGSIISRLLVSRPVVWLSSNLRDGWNVMMQGLAFGVSEAGISRGRKPLALDAEVAPRSKTQLKQQAVTASVAEYLDARVGAVSQLGRGGVQHMRQLGSRASILADDRWRSSRFDRIARARERADDRGCRCATGSLHCPHSSLYPPATTWA